MENNQEFRVVKINFFKKIWYSITKFEKYPEMATEGTGRAFLYLIGLLIIFSIVITSCLLYNFNRTVQQGIKYLDENISEIYYEDGSLKIKPKNANDMKIESDLGTLIIDTETTDNEKITQYQNQIQQRDLGILWLNNKVVVSANGIEQSFYYGDLMQSLNISKLEKSDIINYLENNNKIYIIYFLVMFIVTFILYFIGILIDILVLSLFGVITSYIAKIKIRYRAMFNMSVYAFTISIILKLLYVTANMFIDFNIKYFDFMYSAIAYICLVASIFMIKSDVIKQQIELMKIMNEKQQKQQENEKEEPDDKEEKEEKEEKKEEKENDKSESKKNKKPTVNDEAENQGSEA